MRMLKRDEYPDSSDLDAVKSWGPLVIADVVGGDLAENTVTLRIRGPMPHTILGAQWFLFHDAPPAAERLPFPLLHNSDEQCVSPELMKELEELYQIERGYEPMDEEYSAKLYDADPNCKHVHDPNNWSGIKCCKCGGWFCL